MERDFFEEYVADNFSCMGTWYDKDGNEIEVCSELELTDEQIRKIAIKFGQDREVSNLLCELDNICMEYIAEELGIHS